MSTGVPRKVTTWHQDLGSEHDIAVNIYRHSGKSGTAICPTEVLVPAKDGDLHEVIKDDAKVRGRTYLDVVPGVILEDDYEYDPEEELTGKGKSIPPGLLERGCTFIQVFRNDLVYHRTPLNKTETENTELTALRFHHSDSYPRDRHR